MNSEELEISLRTEFESYLKNVFADVRQEISQLQSKVEADLESYKAQLDESFKEVLDRADKIDFDAGFKDSVLEHLRLARDEGSRISAAAFAAAEDLKEQQAAENATVPAGPGVKELNAAVSDISDKDSQGEILKTLVHHASQFAARGAFFVVKKDHFVAWRTFDGKDSEETVREVFLPVSADSILSEAVRSLTTVESNSETYGDDAQILEKLGFGAPDKMYAVPLIARGRGVAVLYADQGSDGGEVDIEALETMTHVAGLTVEILAAHGGQRRKTVAEQEVAESAAPASEVAPTETETAPSYQSPATEETAYQTSTSEQTATEASDSAPMSENEARENAFSENNSSVSEAQYDYSAQDSSSEATLKNESEAEQNPVPADHYSTDYSSQHSYSDQREAEKSNESAADYGQTGENYPTYDDGAWQQPADAAQTESEYMGSPVVLEEAPAANSWEESTGNSAPMISAQEYAQNYVKEADSPTKEFSFTPSTGSSETAYHDSSANSTNGHNKFEPVAQPESYTPVTSTTNFGSQVSKPTENYAEQSASQVPAATSSSTTKTRLSERNVDLPIEVSEDERRLHNDARRFARLLVSEIKLYNEQKVKEGRASDDLYEKLREAIDRSREMYDKRVQPPVAAKFDYFHYELVNTLAEGNSKKLGESYPGAAV